MHACTHSQQKKPAGRVEIEVISLHDVLILLNVLVEPKKVCKIHTSPNREGMMYVDQVDIQKHLKCREPPKNK